MRVFEFCSCGVNPRYAWALCEKSIVPNVRQSHLHQPLDGRELRWCATEDCLLGRSCLEKTRFPVESGIFVSIEFGGLARPLEENISWDLPREFGLQVGKL